MWRNKEIEKESVSTFYINTGCSRPLAYQFKTLSNARKADKIVDNTSFFVRIKLLIEHSYV